MCSIGFISGDTASHGSTLTLFLFRNSTYPCNIRPCIIIHQYCRPMPLKERNSFRLQNLVNVTLSIEVALHNSEPVRSRVCNPRSTGSAVICHPTCLLETLAQPNYCVSVTTERSTDVGDIVATSKYR